MSSVRKLLPAIPVLLATLSVALATAPWAAGRHHARRTPCSAGHYPAHRDPSNPLGLRIPPGPNPLNGARFFVQGPRHGLAAAGIEHLLGIGTPRRFPENESWATFDRRLHRGAVGRRLARDPLLAHRVRLLEKIARRPETVRFSLYSGGGGPGAIRSQVRKFLCGTIRADPRTVPLISTYFLYHHGYCPSTEAILFDRPLVTRWASELAAGLGRHPAVLFLELDAIGSSACMHGTRLDAWLTNLRIEVRKLTALPHAVVYIEGGYSDSLAPGPTARRLVQAGVGMTRGFFTNDTHYAWTSSEIAWGNRVSALSGHSYFVVNTAGNGRGPKRNRHPAHQGNEALCNPPGRGLGPAPTTSTGFAQVDAFLWTGTPGRSAGPCGHGYAPPGTFDDRWALSLSASANGQLGRGYPSRPY
jgi:endoglucanase